MVSQQTNANHTTFEPLPLTNNEVADRLERVAELLEAGAENPFRITAYRKAAQTVRALPAPLDAWGDAPQAAPRNRLVVPGLPRKSTLRKLFPQEPADETATTGGKIEQLARALRELAGIGHSLAHSIATLTLTGRCELLAELEKDTSAEDVLSTVPGIGPELAERIHTQLGIETLPELAAAASDGRLAHVPGFGVKRLRAVRETLAGRLRLTRREIQTAARPATNAPLPDEPTVEELLSIDGQYRRLAEAGLLRKVAPKKFNPTRAAWLPVLHAQRGGRLYTAMYSNTARAHDLGTTRDWVVIHRHDARGQGQWTVVTAQYGPRKGQRVVRGREEE